MGLGAVGVAVPGMPTTVFLIVASWCFARSCPWLTDRLIRTRFFRPFLSALEPGAVMPRRAKAIALVMMWSAIAISSTLMLVRGWHWALPVATAALGVAGSWCVVRQGRRAAAIGAEGSPGVGVRRHARHRRPGARPSARPLPSRVAS